MNLLGFVDELVKIGGMRCLYKRAHDGDVDMAGVPQGLMDDGPAPQAIRAVPDEAATRIRNGQLPAAILAGRLGGITTAKQPVDREKYDRRYVWRR